MLKKCIPLAALACVAAVLPSAAEFVKNEPAPRFTSHDVHGKSVVLEDILAEKPPLVVLFFFTPEAGEAIAVKLDVLNQQDLLEVVAFGLEQDEEALRAFADEMGIDYYILDEQALRDAGLQEKLEVLPTTVFVETNSGTIERVLRGDNERNRNILTRVAENFMQQRHEHAAEIAEQAVREGEDAKEAREVKGLVLATEGKLDEAEEEFREAGSLGGLARVAYERGDYSQAEELAAQAQDNPLAQTVRGQVQLRQGDVQSAEQTLSRAMAMAEDDWQKAEAANMRGRARHAQGRLDEAVHDYQQAVSLDSYNVNALSNEAAAYREQGGAESLEKAQDVLERASSIREDAMVAAMLRQVQEQLEEANDIERRKLINQQIADLTKRYEELKDAGQADSVDDWTTRPVVLALLPGTRSPVVFERAGTELVLQRELETQLQANGSVRVVERQMLDQLLQELNLGSSDLADQDTQRRLGQVLSAGWLGFLEFAEAGSEILAYLRLVDTETFGIAMQASEPLDEDSPLKTVDAVAARVQRELSEERKLQGLVADAADEQAIIINLGADHGVSVGQEFAVLEEGEPVEVGGRVIAHRTRPIATIKVSAVEPGYAVAALSEKRDGAQIAREMKVTAR